MTGAACAVTQPVCTAVMIVMVAKSEVDKLKQKRRKATRTLLQPESGQSRPSVLNRPRKHLVDSKLVSRLPFNANGGVETAGLLCNNNYGNPTSSRPVVIAETAPAEPAEAQKQTWCEWSFSCRYTRN